MNLLKQTKVAFEKRHKRLKMNYHSKRFIIVSWGGIGDAIICTPALKELKEKYPSYKIILYAVRKAHLDVFRNNPSIHSLRLFWRYPRHIYAHFFNRRLKNYIRLHFQHVSIYENIYSKSVKEIVGDIFSLKIRDLQTLIYLTPSEEKNARERLALYRNVIIMHIHATSSINHLWPIERWIQVVKELPYYTFIQLGLTSEPYVQGALDWRGQTTLREAFAIIKYATSFVGVDSSLAHVTNAFNVPGVVLFGDSNPLYWGHANNINLYKKVVCSPCYYLLWNQPCPYNHDCMNLITVKDVKEALILQVNSRK